MKQITCREIETDDKLDFFTLVDEFYHSDGVHKPIPRSHYQRTFKYIMENRNLANAFLLYSNSDLAGYGQISFAYSNEAGGFVLWIEEVYIRQDFQGQGLGSYFINYILTEYQNKVRRIRLEVEPENIGAKGLYERLGFRTLVYEPYYIDYAFPEL